MDDGAVTDKKADGEMPSETAGNRKTAGREQKYEEDEELGTRTKT